MSLDLLEKIYSSLEDFAIKGRHKMRLKITYGINDKYNDDENIKAFKAYIPGIKVEKISSGLYQFNWKPSYKDPPDMYDPDVRNNERLIDSTLNNLHKLTYEGRKKVFYDLLNTIREKKYIKILDKDLDTHNQIKLIREYHKYMRNKYFPLVKNWKVLESESYIFELNIG